MKNIVYFDLETQKSADEVGGWGNIRRMGMSVGVTYSTARGGYQIYGERQVNDLIEELRRADLVVGFNIERFDYEVLQGHNEFFDYSQLNTLDLLVDLMKTLPHRLSLDSIATASLGIEKDRRRHAGAAVVQGRAAHGHCRILLLRREGDQARPRVRAGEQAGALPQQVRRETVRAGEVVAQPGFQAAAASDYQRL